MNTFSYKGYRADSGAPCRGLVEGDTAKAAREKLSGQGILAHSLQAAGTAKAGLPSTHRAVLYRELASLLKAGMPLVNALGMLIRTPELKGAADSLAAVRDHVREGSSLAGALKLGIATVSPFEAATIDVAERTATMDTTLEQLAVFTESQEWLRQRVLRAMIYPALVLVLGVVVAIVMLGVLLPRAQQMIGSAAVLPLLTRVMLRLADAFFPWGLAGGVMLVVGLGGWWRFAWRRLEWRVRFNRCFCRLPFVGPAYSGLVSSRFARTLGILVRSGVSLVEAVPLAAGASGSAWCQQLAVAASDRIRHGCSLEAAVQTIPPLADTLTGWIGVGEASGELPKLLDHAADRCDRRFESLLARTLALLEPLLLLLIGGFVLLITLAVLLPVFSLTDTILR